MVPFLGFPGWDSNLCLNYPILLTASQIVPLFIDCSSFVYIGIAAADGQNAGHMIYHSV
jgi:hypothetical protein